MDSVYVKYYSNQIGGRGANFGNLYRVSTKVQKGRGIGSIFSGLFRFLKPHLLSGLNAVKDEALRVGGEIMQNIGQKPIKELLREKGVEGLHNLTAKAVDKMKKTMAGGGSLRCLGKRIKGGTKSKKKHSKLSTKRKRVARKPVAKKRKSSSKSKHHRQKRRRILDIFD